MDRRLLKKYGLLQNSSINEPSDGFIDAGHHRSAYIFKANLSLFLNLVIYKNHGKLYIFYAILLSRVTSLRLIEVNKKKILVTWNH